MTPEQQRIKIADARGLFRIMPLRRTTRKGKPDPNGVRLWYCEEHHGGAATYAEVPNYPEDLNAMADAIAHLTPEQIDTFAIELSAIVLENPSKAWWDLNANEVGHVITATAAQQAEAFLKTLNLWEE